MSTKNTIEIFWKRSSRNGPIPKYRPELGRCWVGPGRLRKDGYTDMRFSGKRLLCHRFVYESVKGIIQDGLEIDQGKTAQIGKSIWAVGVNLIN